MKATAATFIIAMELALFGCVALAQERAPTMGHTPHAADFSAANDITLPVVKLSPSIRSEILSGAPLPRLQMHTIEAFLAEPLVVEQDTLHDAPRVVAGDEDHLLLSLGDRAYVRGPASAPLLAATASRSYRLFRKAVALRDPITKKILGYEAQYVGQAHFLSGEKPADTQAGTPSQAGVVQITKAKEEIHAGDYLLPEPERQYSNWAPHRADSDFSAHVVSLYGGTATRYGSEHHIVAINKGVQDGVKPGLVLALMTQGRPLNDNAIFQRSATQLPDQENGTAMVFRSFDHVAYALIMDIQRSVQVGDRLTGGH